jgi:hypothetical protein
MRVAIRIIYQLPCFFILLSRSRRLPSSARALTNIGPLHVFPRKPFRSLWHSQAWQCISCSEYGQKARPGNVQLQHAACRQLRNIRLVCEATQYHRYVLFVPLPTWKCHLTEVLHYDHQLFQQHKPLLHRVSQLHSALSRGMSAVRRGASWRNSARLTQVAVRPTPVATCLCVFCSPGAALDG